MAREKTKRRDAVLNELRAAFESRAVGHAVVDIQPYYCDPAQLKRRGYSIGDIREIFDVARRVGHFAQRMQSVLPQYWIAHVTPTTLAHRGPVRFDPAAMTPAEKNRLAINELRDTVFARGGQSAIGKTGFDAFRNTDLMTQAQGAGVQTLLLSGFYADKCVLETACSAVAGGLRTFVIDDLTLPFVPGDTAHRDALAQAGVTIVPSATVRQAMLDTRHNPAGPR